MEIKWSKAKIRKRLRWIRRETKIKPIGKGSIICGRYFKKDEAKPYKIKPKCTIGSNLKARSWYVAVKLWVQKGANLILDLIN